MLSTAWPGSDRPRDREPIDSVVDQLGDTADGRGDHGQPAARALEQNQRCVLCPPGAQYQGA